MLGQYGEGEYSPTMWEGYTAGEPVVQGDSWLDITKSILSTASSVVTSILKPGATVPTPVVQTASGATITPVTAGFSLSSPLVLGAIGLAAFLMLRGRKK